MPEATKTAYRVRVLHVISHMEKGGAERQLQLLVEASSHEHVVAVLRGNERPTPAEVELIDSLSPYRVFKTVAACIAKHQISLVHLWLPERLTFPALLAARVARKPTVSSDRRKPRSYGRFAIRDRVYYAVHAGSHRVVSNYPILGHEYRIRRGLGLQRKSVVIPNGISAPTRRSVRIERTPKGLLFIGRLVEQKRVELLVAQYPTLARECGISSLAIVGSGPERRKLELLATKSGLSDQISFFGERRDWCSTFDPNEYFLVLPSVSEGMSNTVFEAVVSGFFPIVSASPELEELFRPFDEKPEFFETRFPSTLTRAVHRARSFTPHQLASKVASMRVSVTRTYSIAKMAAAYDELYREMTVAGTAR